MSAPPANAEAARAALARGLEAMRARDPDRAAEELREAVRLDPSLVRAQFALGRVLVYLSDVVVGTPTRDLGTLDEAIAALRIAVEDDPRSSDRRYWLAKALRDRGFQEEAVETYRAAIELDANNAPAHRELAFLLADMGLDGAAEEAQRAIELLPADATLWFLLGMEREVSDDLPGAKQAYERAIELDWTIPSPYSKLAVVLAREGDQERSAAAQAAYQAWYAYGPVLRARNLEANEKPHDADVLAALAEVQLQGQRFDLARETLERAIAASPGDDALIARLADVEILASRGPERSESGFILPLPASDRVQTTPSDSADESR